MLNSLAVTVALLVLCCTPALVSGDLCDTRFCTPSQAIASLRSVKFTDSYYKEAINDIIKSVEPYVYLDILKNPPQPEGFTDYFKPIDLIAELKKVKTENTNFYDFYREVKKLLMATQDGHFSFMFTGNKQFDNKLTSIYYLFPVSLYTITNTLGQTVMKGVPLSGGSDVYNYFPNGAEIKEIVTKNTNVPIVSINGQSPFDFVLNFGNKYYNYPKNANAKYTIGSGLLQGMKYVYYAPLDVEDFSNITVVYENGEKFTNDFYFVNMAAPLSAENKESTEDFVEFSREMLRNNPLGKPLGYEDILRAFKSGEKPWKPLDEREVFEEPKSIDLRKARVRREASDPTSFWDYVTQDGGLRCKIDNENKVNFYSVSSFSGQNEQDFINVLNYCTIGILNNTHPIIVLVYQNGGGSIMLSNIFQEMVQPDMVSRTFFSYKAGNKTVKGLNNILKYVTLSDPHTCKKFESGEELMKETETDDYGDGVTHTRTKPSLLVYQETRRIIDPAKSQLPRRKPTEIIVFTDSYSFSAASIFTKGLREAGGAIMVGYNGYPGSPSKTFDIGQSPTQVLSGSTQMSALNPVQYARLYTKGITFASMSFGETFRPEDVYNNKSPLIPREFLVDPADERVEYFGNDYYDYVNFAKKIFSKYETYCNPNNPKLHMREPRCDAVINKEHMHGGFTCGVDGKWTTTCEGYYCDDGYYFDSHTKECVRDPCYTLTPPSPSPSSSSSSQSPFSSSSSFSSNESESEESYLIDSNSSSESFAGFESSSTIKESSSSSRSFSSGLTMSFSLLFFVLLMMI